MVWRTGRNGKDDSDSPVRTTKQQPDQVKVGGQARSD